MASKETLLFETLKNSPFFFMKNQKINFLTCFLFSTIFCYSAAYSHNVYRYKVKTYPNISTATKTPVEKKAIPQNSNALPPTQNVYRYKVKTYPNISTTTKIPVEQKAIPQISNALPPSQIVKEIATKPHITETSGHYLEADFVRTRTHIIPRLTYNDSTLEIFDPTDSSTHGFGLSYKYAFNFNKFFIAPGLFFEQNSTGSQTTKKDSESLSLQIKNRYGIKADFGYDINNFISPYLTFGYGAVRYRSQGNGEDTYSNIIKAANRSHAYSGFVGAGLKINLNDRLAVNFEYNQQRLRAEGRVPELASDYISKITFKTRLDIMKVGLLYNF